MRERRRPSFMGMTALCAVAGTALVGFVAERAHDPAEARAELLADADESARDELLAMGSSALGSARAARLLGERGVELLVAQRAFELPLGNGPVAGRPPGEAVRARAEVLVAEELSRYPRSLLRRARLYRVLLCEGLTESGRPIPSLPNYQRTLLLDVEATPDFLRRLVHHELFHFADYAGDEQVQHDPSWAALSGDDFVYGSGGRFLRDPRSSLPGSAPPGFVTGYATSALEEDKAETFSFLMTAAGALAERTRADGVLAAKVARVKQELAKLSPELDDEFWRRGGVR